MGERNKRTKLKNTMGPGSIWAVAVGSIIGWGCFIQGGLWTERAGGPLPLFLGYFVARAVTFNDRGRLQLFLYDRKIPGSGW